MRDLVDMTFEGEKALWRAIAAHGSRNWQVSVNSIRLEAVGFGAVETERFVPGAARHGEAMRAVCPRVANRMHRNSHQGAIAFDPAAHAHNHRMAEAGRGELLLAAVLHAHRLARFERQYGGNGFQEHFLFAAKAAPDARFDHAHTRDEIGR